MGAAVANQEEPQNKHWLYHLHAPGADISVIGIFPLLYLSFLQTPTEADSEAHYKSNRLKLDPVLFFYMKRTVFHQTTIVLLKMTWLLPPKSRYCSILQWPSGKKLFLVCSFFIFFTLKPASKASWSFCHSQRAVVETHSFPTSTYTFINSPFPHEGSLSQLKQKKICTKNMWRRDRNAEKMEKSSRTENLFVSLLPTVTQAGKKTPQQIESHLWEPEPGPCRSNATPSCVIWLSARCLDAATPPQSFITGGEAESRRRAHHEAVTELDSV